LKSEKSDLGRNGAFEANFKGRVTETKGKILTGADLEDSQREVMKRRRAKVNIKRKYNSHKILHKTFIVPSVMQHFVNLISPFTLHVSAFIGHLQV
jgi:hypothetical protein